MLKEILSGLAIFAGGGLIAKLLMKPKQGVVVTGTPKPFSPISRATDSPIASEFIESTNFTPANRPQSHSIDWIVIHTMENGEVGGQASSVAKWFANAGAPKDPAPRASVHYCVDNQTCIQTLQEKNIAWGAAGANDNGIHIEHAGRASQSVDQWRDSYSMDELELSAQLAADICQRRGIEPVFLTAAMLKQTPRPKGFTGHVDVNAAFKQGDHSDPGPNFPWDYYLTRVTHYLGSGNIA